MAQHTTSELTIWVYVRLLIALGEIGFGWLLVSQSKRMISFFSEGGKGAFGFSTQIFTWVLRIAGWMFLVFGSLFIAMFLFAIGMIAFRSVWP